MKQHCIIKIIVCLFCLGIFVSANAATVDVTRLNIDSITVSFTALGSDQSDTVVYSPPTIWNMGEYQGVILDYSSVSSPFYNIVAESTSAYGAPPSSGTVDTSLGTIELNLSDIHAMVSGGFTGDFDLWNALTSTIDSNSYNSTTNAFLYGWSDTTTLKVSVLNTPVNYSILLAGTASTVPVPAAVWLFGTGLIGLIGIARRKTP